MRSLGKGSLTDPYSASDSAFGTEIDPSSARSYTPSSMPAFKRKFFGGLRGFSSLKKYAPFGNRSHAKNVSFLSRKPRAYVGRSLPRRASRLRRGGVGKMVKFNAPVAKGFRYRTKAPRFSSRGNVVKIRHREYVIDLISSSTTEAFSISQLAVNSGNQILCPWLATVSSCFLQYRFLSAKFSLESQVSTATAGTMFMCCLPDASSNLLSNKSAVMAVDGAVRSSDWGCVTYTVPKNILTRLPRYLTSGVQGAVVGGGNLANDISNVCQLQYGAVGVSGTSVPLAELYFEYEVELFTPDSSQLSTGMSLFATGVPVGNGSSLNLFTSSTAINSVLVSSYGPSRNCIVVNPGTTTTSNFTLNCSGPQVITIFVYNATGAWSNDFTSFVCVDNNGVSQTLTGVCYPTIPSSLSYISVSGSRSVVAAFVALLSGQPPFNLQFACPYVGSAGYVAAVALYMSPWYTGQQF